VPIALRGGEASCGPLSSISRASSVGLSRRGCGAQNRVVASSPGNDDFWQEPMHQGHLALPCSRVTSFGRAGNFPLTHSLPGRLSLTYIYPSIFEGIFALALVVAYFLAIFVSLSRSIFSYSRGNLLAFLFSFLSCVITLLGRPCLGTFP